MTVDDSGQKKRGIEAVTQFYLSDPGRIAARAARAAPPKAQSQDDRDDSAMPNVPFAAQPPGELGPSANLTDTTKAETSSRRAIVIFSDHLAQESVHVEAYAQQLASTGSPVMLLQADADCFTLTEFSHSESPSVTIDPASADELDALFADLDHYQDDSPAVQSALDGALRRRLDDASQRDVILLLNFAPVHIDDAVTLIPSCARAVVLTTLPREAIVSTYAQLKWFADLPAPKPEVDIFFCQCSQPAQVETIFDRLSATALRFLELPVNLAGHDGEPARDIVRSELLVGRYDQHVMGDIMDYLSQNSSVPNTPDPASDASAAPAAPPASLLPTWREGYLWPISIDTFPATDTELIHCLEVAVGRWLHWLPGSIILPMPLPAEFDPTIRLLLDKTGRAHVFFATLTGPAALLQSALAARHWLIKNIEVVADAFPQVKIDRSLGVEMLLVAGGDPAAIRRRFDNIADCPVTFLTLHRLRNERGSSLLVTE